MSAYWIGRAQTRDPEGYKAYGALIAAAAPAFPYQPLVRGAGYQVLEGPDDFDRFVVLKFPSSEAAIAYYNSPEYQQASAIRRAASGRCELVICNGVD